MMQFWKTLVRPHLDYYVHFGHTANGKMPLNLKEHRIFADVARAQGYKLQGGVGNLRRLRANLIKV